MKNRGKKVTRLDGVKTLLTGEYDQRDALVTIRSETSVVSTDFGEMLMRMYLRWAERHGYSVNVYDTSYADESSIKSITFQVYGPSIYGILSVEQGIHRLTHSPLDSQGRAAPLVSSTATVEVIPGAESIDQVEVDENELQVDVYRGPGPGGQDSSSPAVRLTHLPTGIVTTCSSRISPVRNKAGAMTILTARLLDLRRQEERAKSGSGDAATVRSYVLHPYRTVWDPRTSYKVTDPSLVLDGEIDRFIETAIRWRCESEELSCIRLTSQDSLKSS